MGRDIDPREAVLEDLGTKITEWRNNGEHIILQMDANEDVRSGNLQNMLRELGMQEAILKLHIDSQPPKTCRSNTRREPINGIFTTPGIKPSAGATLDTVE